MTQGQLQNLLQTISGANRVLILPHNDPDPDAIASAVALRYLLATRLNVPVQMAYRGIIGRAENKALARYLGRPLRQLTADVLNQASAIALVDTQPGAGNSPLPPTTAVSVVIDHHPRRAETAAARFADVRANVGATSTILTGYLQTAELEPTPEIATALFYGIKTDTMGLGRSAGPADAAAYAYLQQRIDTKTLFDIERAQVPAAYFKSLAATLQAAHIFDGVLISYVGQMDYPDLSAEIADWFLRLEGLQWVICLGTYNDQLILAVRSRSRQGGAGRVAQAIIGQRGAAGGHGVMAGGQIPLQGVDPTEVAKQVMQLTKEYFNIGPDVEGRPLV